MVYERLTDSTETSDMDSHVPTFMSYLMIVKWRLNYSKPFLHQSKFFGIISPDARQWAHSQFRQILPTNNMGMSGQQCTTPTGPQQRPKNHQQIPPLQMNTAGIPVYHLDASATQALLTHTTRIAVGSTQGSTQESKTD